eukprot:1111627-Amphidinium_carterae.1
MPSAVTAIDESQVCSLVFLPSEDSSCQQSSRSSLCFMTLRVWRLSVEMALSSSAHEWNVLAFVQTESVLVVGSW